MTKSQGKKVFSRGWFMIIYPYSVQDAVSMDMVQLSGLPSKSSSIEIEFVPYLLQIASLRCLCLITSLFSIKYPSKQVLALPDKLRVT